MDPGSKFDLFYINGFITRHYCRKGSNSPWKRQMHSRDSFFYKFMTGFLLIAKEPVAGQSLADGVQMPKIS